MTIEQAVGQLEKDSGDQYDPNVVKALVKLISDGEIDIEKKPIYASIEESSKETIG